MDSILVGKIILRIVDHSFDTNINDGILTIKFMLKIRLV